MSEIKVRINGRLTTIKYDEKSINLKMTDEEYLQTIMQTEYYDFFKNLTYDGFKFAKNRAHNLIDEEYKLVKNRHKGVPIGELKINSPDEALLRKKIAQIAVQHIQEQKVKKDKKKSKDIEVEVKNKRISYAREEIKLMCNLETYKVNEYIQNLGKSIGMDWVPIVFKYAPKVYREVLETKDDKVTKSKFRNFYDVEVFIDEQYLMKAQETKISFIMFLQEKDEFGLASWYFNNSAEIKGTSFKSFTSTAHTNLDASALRRLKILYQEFSDLIKKNPDKYDWVKTIKGHTQFHDISKNRKYPYIQHLNNNTTVKVFRIRDYYEKFKDQGIYDRLSKAEKLDAQIDKAKIWALSTVNKNLKKHTELINDSDSYLNWLENEELFFSKADQVSIPATFFKNTSADVKAVFLDALNMLQTNLLEYEDKLFKDAKAMKGERFLDTLKQKAGEEGFEIEQLSELYYDIDNEKRKKWRETKQIKFPNIDAILFWWVTSGQFKLLAGRYSFKGSQSLADRWDRLRYVRKDTDRKYNFINKVIFQIANGVYIKKIENAIANGYIKSHPDRGVGKRAVPYVKGEKKRKRMTRNMKEAQARRVEKYGNYLSNIRKIDYNRPYRDLNAEQDKAVTRKRLKGRDIKKRKYR